MLRLMPLLHVREETAILTQPTTAGRQFFRGLSQPLPKIAGMAGPARFSGFAHPSRYTLPLTRTRQVYASGYAPSLSFVAIEPITEAYRARRYDGGIDAQIPVGSG